MFLAGVGVQVEEEGAEGVGVGQGVARDLEQGDVLGEGEGRDEFRALEFGGGEAAAHVGGHEGVLVQRLVVRVRARPHVHVAAVGDADVAAEAAKERGLADRGVVGHGPAQGPALHVGRAVDAEVLQERGTEVDRLDEGLAALAPDAAAGVPSLNRASDRSV
ncbi:hypothetical protein [Streptomyces sp. NPDC013171]|uniref:hypothetical protein n=1 Tax=Streptomyces sp. NPDC013171 TaxID=3364863 RepID=UPI0036817308